MAQIGDARRQAAAGNYTEAEASLVKAEKAFPKLPETQQARDDIARLKTPEGQPANHILRARLAVDHDDRAAAEAELAEAARLKADAPEIVELRAALQAAHDKKARREARIAGALARMREAMARRDFATANSALNEAERVDVQESTVRQARGEFTGAQNAPVEGLERTSRAHSRGNGHRGRRPDLARAGDLAMRSSASRWLISPGRRWS